MRCLITPICLLRWTSIPPLTQAVKYGKTRHLKSWRPIRTDVFPVEEGQEGLGGIIWDLEILETQQINTWLCVFTQAPNFIMAGLGLM